ncbi:MAG: hypothetical protein H6925_04385 [Holosporaceae bacterium]|nr:MAG: hypothetical protein H6925_04385 [Holosporaceae bacterium]
MATFRLDLKDGCAGMKSQCRHVFCKSNCFNEEAPTDTKIIQNCRAHGSPLDLPNISFKEKNLYRDRFEDKQSRRKREVSNFIATVLSNQIWCESECDYDEKSPSCRVKGKVNHHWKTCASKCFFIKDIKEHAEGCSQKLSLAPKPARRKKITFKR